VISFGTATLIELVYTAIAAGGFLFACQAFAWANGDRLAIKRGGYNGARRRIAQNNLITTCGVAAAFLIFVVIGTAACLTPNTPTEAHRITSYIAGTGFVLIELGLLAKLIKDAIDRHYVMQRLSAEYRAFKGDGW
jgi:archaellum biogenesis protein FlaJ (TadC family)